MVDGPHGPVRDSMREPPQCLIPSPSSDHQPSSSTYSITLAPHLLSPAVSPSSSALAIRQLCRRNDFSSAGTKDGVLPSITAPHHLRGGGPRRAVEEIVWTWVELSEVTRGRGVPLDVEVAGCRHGFYVAAYVRSFLFLLSVSEVKPIVWLEF